MQAAHSYSLIRTVTTQSKNRGTFGYVAIIGGHWRIGRQNRFIMRLLTILTIPGNSRNGQNGQCTRFVPGVPGLYLVLCSLIRTQSEHSEDQAQCKALVLFVAQHARRCATCQLG